MSYSSSNITSFSRIATTLLTSLSSKSWHAIRHWTVIVHLCYRLKTIGSSSTIDTRRWVIIPKHKVSPFTPRLLYSLACLLPHTGQIRRTADPTFSAGSDAEVELSSAVWRTWNESRTTMVFRANTRRALYIYMVLHWFNERWHGFVVEWYTSTMSAMLLCNYEIWQCRSTAALTRDAFYRTINQVVCVIDLIF